MNSSTAGDAYEKYAPKNGFPSGDIIPDALIIDFFDGQGGAVELGTPVLEDLRTLTTDYQGLTDLEYPFHDRTVTVITCGWPAQVSARQNVVVKEVGHPD